MLADFFHLLRSEYASAVVMQGYGFGGAQRQTQDSRAIVFEVHANVAGAETNDVASQSVLGCRGKVGP